MIRKSYHSVDSLEGTASSIELDLASPAYFKTESRSIARLTKEQNLIVATSFCFAHLITTDKFKKERISTQYSCRDRIPHNDHNAALPRAVYDSIHYGLKIE